MIACSFGIAVVILTQFIAKPLVGLFTPDAAVAAAGGQYLRGYIWDSFFAGVQFIREEGYTAAGFSREITVIDYGFTTDTEKFVTEIMIPLQKV